jgi:uncharacterized protein (DUF1684 family)
MVFNAALHHQAGDANLPGTKKRKDVMTQISQFRAAKDDFFANDPHSPLTPEQKREFHGLDYYPENPDLRLEIPIEKFQQVETIRMQTSTGDIQDYTREGMIHFEVDGDDAELTIFRNDHGLFLPFVDSMAGRETYGAGRYLEPVELPDGKILVDFNLAYNPYCAYNDLYSCPLTPWENRLKVPIRAGEKSFK